MFWAQQNMGGTKIAQNSPVATGPHVVHAKIQKKSSNLKFSPTYPKLERRLASTSILQWLEQGSQTQIAPRAKRGPED